MMGLLSLQRVRLQFSQHNARWLVSLYWWHHLHFIQSPRPSRLPPSYDCTLTVVSTLWCEAERQPDILMERNFTVCVVLLQTQNCVFLISSHWLLVESHVYLGYKINGFLVQCWWKCKLVEPLWRAIYRFSKKWK